MGCSLVGVSPLSADVSHKQAISHVLDRYHNFFPIVLSFWFVRFDARVIAMSFFTRNDWTNGTELTSDPPYLPLLGRNGLLIDVLPFSLISFLAVSAYLFHLAHVPSFLVCFYSCCHFCFPVRKAWQMDKGERSCLRYEVHFNTATPSPSDCNQF